MSAPTPKAARTAQPKPIPRLTGIELDVWVSFATAALAGQGARPDVTRVATLADAMVLQYRKRATPP